MSRQQVRFIVGELDKFTSRLISRMSINITAELIERTPVDTGWARANWVPSIGVPPPDVSQERNIEQISTDVARQQAGIATLAAYRVDKGRVFISNNVPYIIYLNEGSSAQAPAGFVQQAITSGIRSLRRGI